jgi:hypothetical protein
LAVLLIVLLAVQFQVAEPGGQGVLQCLMQVRGAGGQDLDAFVQVPVGGGLGDLRLRKLRPRRSSGMFVLVEYSAQTLPSSDVQVSDLVWFGDRWRQRLQRA